MTWPTAKLGEGLAKSQDWITLDSDQDETLVESQLNTMLPAILDHAFRGGL